MDFKAEIRDALRGMVREMMIDGALQATVKTVDKQAGTIVATGLREDIDYFDVRLKAVVADGNGRGIIAYPVLGSQVSIVVLDGIDTMAFVSQMSDIESFLVRADSGVSIELTAAGQLLLNGDGFGGLVKVVELKAQLDKTNAVVAGMKTAIDAWVPKPGDGGTVLKTLMTTALAGKTLGSFGGLENPHVQHG